VLGGDDGVRAILVLVDGTAEMVVGRIVDARPGLVLVNALARLQLAARRRGCAIRLREVCPELYELLGFAGLSGAVDSQVLVVESRGQTEGREELGVEEIRDRDDPSA
jgi:hypothetical protein